MTCAECGCSSHTAAGWIALLSRDPDVDDGLDEVVAFWRWEPAPTWSANAAKTHLPDDFDDVWLDEFLGDAPNWSTEDVSTARWLLAQQRQALDDAHPRDEKTRETLREVVDALEQALAKHD